MKDKILVLETNNGEKRIALNDVNTITIYHKETDFDITISMDTDNDTYVSIALSKHYQLKEINPTWKGKILKIEKQH